MRISISIILAFLIASCATSPKVPPAATHVTSRAQVLIEPETITINIPPALVGLPADYFSTTNIAGPWTYRTDDFYTVTNDGVTYAQFSNSPPRSSKEYYMIVPLGGPFPLPKNIITNKP